MKFLFGHTGGLQLYPYIGFVQFPDVDYVRTGAPAASHRSPAVMHPLTADPLAQLYSSSVLAISVGYMLIMLLCIPM